VPSPEPTAFAWEPSQADWDQALAQARQLTVEQAAGQAIVASYSGTSPTKLTAFIEARDLGGVMLQGDATKSKKVTESLTKAANTAGGDRDWPVMVAVDQEGGTVARLRGMIPGMPAFMAAGATTDKAAVHEAYADQGWYVRDMGFNTNFAPDADVTVGLSDPVIRSRSAGSDAQNVAATVDAAVAGYTDAGVISTVKHFPGHGSVDVDSHKGLPVQAATVAQLEKRDFVPFASAIDAGVPSVMVGHIALHEWGDVPASVAPAAYAYLRDDLGFTGVAITDAMNMGAIVDQYEPGRATVLALEAGADLVLMPADVDAAISGIVAAVKSGELPRERLDEAVARSVLMMRWQAGLVPTSTDAPPAHYARDFAARAVTVVTPTCSGELVSDTVTVTGGWEHERTTLAAALAKRGIGAGDESHPGTTVRLAGNSSTEVEGDVVVALDGPWILDKSKATTYITLYGRSDDALEALADILVGKVTSGSSWPVTLKNVPGKPC
jgi:beta-N-acetylhexosaminidase